MLNLVCRCSWMHIEGPFACCRPENIVAKPPIKIGKHNCIDILAMYTIYSYLSLPRSQQSDLSSPWCGCMITMRLIEGHFGSSVLSVQKLCRHCRSYSRLSSASGFRSASSYPWENFHFSSRLFSSAAVTNTLNPYARLQLGRSTS